MSRPFTDFETELLEALEALAPILDKMERCLSTCVQRNGNELKEAIVEFKSVLNHAMKAKGI
jgi:hypothetical protein